MLSSCRDSTAIGDPVQVCVDGSRSVYLRGSNPVGTSFIPYSWILLSVSKSVLQLAIRTSRQTCSSPLHCLLLGSAFISGLFSSQFCTEIFLLPPLLAIEEGVVIEVDRFDVGRTSKFCLQPTAVVPGDVIIHCTVSCSSSRCNLYMIVCSVQVDLEEAPHRSVSVGVAELQRTLQSTVGSVDPSHFLHLQLYLTAHLPDSISLLCTVHCAAHLCSCIVNIMLFPLRSLCASRFLYFDPCT